MQPDEAALADDRENVAGSAPTGSPSSPSTTTRSSTTPSGGCATRWPTAPSRYHLLGEYFTLAELREVYEAVLDRELDPANFRRQVKATPEIEETDQYLQGGKHRPPRLYRFTGRPGLDPDNRSTP